MNKFVIKIISFLMPIIIILGLVEYSLALIPGDEYSQKKKIFLDKLNNIEVLSVGTSHGYRGINPEYFDYSGFNMGESGQPLYYDQEIISKYLKDMKKIKLVIQPIDCFTMGLDPNMSDSKFRYSKYYGIPVENMNIKDLLNLKNYSLIALEGGVNSLKIIFNKLKGKTMSETLFINSYGTLIDKGSETMNNKESLSKESAIQRINGHTSSMNNEYIKVNQDNVIKTINKLQQMEIQEVIIIFPMSRSYREDSRVQKEYAKVIQFTDELFKDNNVKIYNYFDDKRFTDEDFVDVDHLNSQGSKKMSIIINEEILKPNLQKQ